VFKKFADNRQTSLQNEPLSKPSNKSVSTSARKPVSKPQPAKQNVNRQCCVVLCWVVLHLVVLGCVASCCDVLFCFALCYVVLLWGGVAFGSENSLNDLPRGLLKYAPTILLKTCLEAYLRVCLKACSQACSKSCSKTGLLKDLFEDKFAQRLVWRRAWRRAQKLVQVFAHESGWKD
jgi:hypothetical protein